MKENNRLVKERGKKGKHKIRGKGRVMLEKELVMRIEIRAFWQSEECV